MLLIVLMGVVCYGCAEGNSVSRRMAAGQQTADATREKKAKKSPPGQSRPKRNESDQRESKKRKPASVRAQEPAAKYDKLKLHKNTTLLVMSLAPDQRSAYFIRHSGFELDPEQLDHADRICREYDDQYLALQRKRAKLMSNAPNVDDIVNKRWAIRQEIFNLNEIVKSRIHREVRRPDQVADFTKNKDAKNSND